MMVDRPTTFAALIERIIGTAEPGQLPHRPVFARGAEITSGRKSDEDWWAILYSVTSAGVILIHQHRIVSPQIEARIDAPQGAVLAATLNVESMQPRGELFESMAKFLSP